MKSLQSKNLRKKQRFHPRGKVKKYRGCAKTGFSVASLVLRGYTETNRSKAPIIFHLLVRYMLDYQLINKEVLQLQARKSREDSRSYR